MEAGFRRRASLHLPCRTSGDALTGLVVSALPGAAVTFGGWRRVAWLANFQAREVIEAQERIARRTRAALQ